MKKMINTLKANRNRKELADCTALLKAYEQQQ